MLCLDVEPSVLCLDVAQITSQILKEGGKQHWHHPMDHRAWSKGQEKEAPQPQGHCNAATRRVSGKKDEIIAVLESPTYREILILALPELAECVRAGRWPCRDSPSLLALGVLQGKLTSENSTRDLQFPPW